MLTNEQRAEGLIKKYGFDFPKIPKKEIRELIEQELSDFQEGSSEYIRLLCGYLYCIGDVSDAPLIEKAKYGVSMDVGCMVDGEWLDSLKGIENEHTRPREEITDAFIAYYQNFEADDSNW